MPVRKSLIRMNHFHRLIFVSVVLTVFGFATAAAAKADPLLFSSVVALQGSTRVDLFSHPNTTVYGNQISFFVDITGILPPTIPNNTLMVTYQAMGMAPIVQSFQIPLFGTV